MLGNSGCWYMNRNQRKRSCEIRIVMQRASASLAFPSRNACAVLGNAAAVAADVNQPVSDILTTFPPP